METSLVPERHHLLPKGLDIAQTADFLRANNKEHFTDEEKRHYSPEEIAEMEHMVCSYGIKMSDLDSILDQVKGILKNGCDKTQTIKIPATAGSKAMTSFRQQDQGKVKAGYEVTPIEVFGLPCDRTFRMVFFKEDGTEYPERNRDLSAKEKHELGGLFLRGRNEGNHFVEEETGEAHQRVI